MARARKRVVRREVLERAAHALLARFLEPDASFLAAHGVDLAALGGAPQVDRSLPRRLYAVLHDADVVPTLPASLAERLLALDALATPDGAAELVRLDVDRALPRGSHGDEDLALVALLDHAELARRARLSAPRETDNRFVEYVPRGPGAVRLSLDAEARAALEARLSALFEELDHTAYCELVFVSGRDEVVLEIDHGSRPRTRDRVDPASLRVDQVTDVTARRAYARLDTRTGRLCVRAPARVREIVRRGFGHVLAGDPDAFRADGLYDLSPLRDLEAALATEGVPRLVRVEVHELSLATADGAHVKVARPRKDLFESTLRSLLETVVDVADPVGVRLYLHVVGRARPIRVQLAADGKHNAVDYDRDDPEVVAVVDEYLRARSILCAPGADAGEDEVEPSLEASSGP